MGVRAAAADERNAGGKGVGRERRGRESTEVRANLHKAGDTRARAKPGKRAADRGVMGRREGVGEGEEGWSRRWTRTRPEEKERRLPAARALFALPRNELVFASSVSPRARARARTCVAVGFNDISTISGTFRCEQRHNSRRNGGGTGEQKWRARSRALSPRRFLPWPKITHHLPEIVRSRIFFL